MNAKQLVLDAVNRLPDDATLAEIAELVAFLGGVQKGLDQIERGETVPHEDVKRIVLGSDF